MLDLLRQSSPLLPQEFDRRPGLALAGGSMRTFRRFRFCASVFLALSMAVGGATAESVGPGKAGGARSLTPSKRSSPPSKTSKSSEPFDHKKAPRPKEPAPRLPKGAAKQPQDRGARRGVAGGRTAAEAAAPVSDPELAALRAADRVLFPRPLHGFKPGWSWGDADPSVQADGLPPVTEALPSATLAEAAHAEWLRSLAMPDFSVRLDPRVVEYLKFYRDTDRGRAIARVWARKVGRYTAAMRAELAKARLPKDLVWLSLIESGHNPTILSPAGAAGLWQFIPESARMYGLTVDRWVDERLDPQRSTEGAAGYLGDLYQRFGTWELAMAAYNMGHGGLLRAVRKYNTNDFWKLTQYEAAIPWETTLYVPKVFAIAIVMNNLRAFGLDDIEPDPAITFDTVLVDSRVPLDDVARAAGVPLDSLRAMNPQYQSTRLPPDPPGSGEKTTYKRWPVRVPRGAGAKATATLLDQNYREKYEPYTVRFGDTLQSIAVRLSVTEASLAELNGVAANTVLTAGSVVLVPRTPKGIVAEDTEEQVVVAPRQFRVPGRRRVFYRVLKDDTLASVANILAVTPEELVEWNDLDPTANIQSGMTLQVFVPKHADLSKVRTVSALRTRILEVGSVEFINHFEAMNGRRRMTVTAKAGDTLAKIGRHYGLSVGMMERINRCSRNRVLQPGEVIVVYAPATGKNSKSASDEVVGVPLAAIRAPRPELLPDADRGTP